MNIFNSLGSNYNLKYALKSLFAYGNDSYLIEYLVKKYDSEVHLFYKGREALEAALKISEIKGDVIFNSFTCEVVVEAIKRAGLRPIALDINSESLNFTIESLKKEVNQNRNIKAVIVQNTLGNNCEIKKIARLCKDRNMVLIEDLAHSVSSGYGDFVCLSFSQDKIIDSISGGALVVRNKKYRNKYNLKTRKIDFFQQIKDRFYPILTWKIRKLYPLGIGKPLHYVLKKFGLLSDPLGKKASYLRELPGWQSWLAFTYLQQLDLDINHRKKISKVYKKYLGSKFVFKGNWLIRFPIKVKNRKEVILKLKNHGIYVSDIWYEKRVIEGFPVSDGINKVILNLPTHKNITVAEAEKISKLINKYAKI